MLAVFWPVGMPGLSMAFYDLLHMGVWKLNIHILCYFAGFAAVFIGADQEGVLQIVILAAIEHVSGWMTNGMRDAKQSLQKRLSTTIEKCTVSCQNRDEKFWEVNAHANTFASEEVSFERPPTIPVGTVLRVSNGNPVPIDSQIIYIESGVTFNEEVVTGQKDTTKKIGDKVLSGAVVDQGVVIVVTTNVWENSYMQGFVDKVKGTDGNETMVGEFFEQLNNYYSLAVAILTIVFALLLPCLSCGRVKRNGKNGAYGRAIMFLIAAAPCALLLSAPVAYQGAIKVLSDQGVLVNSEKSLEYMQSVNAVVFDKSGTLTDVDSLDAASPQMITSKATAGISVQNPFLLNELASLVHATEGFAVATHGKAMTMKRWAKTQPNHLSLVKQWHDSDDSRGISAEFLHNDDVYRTHIGTSDFVKQSLEDGMRPLLAEAVRQNAGATASYVSYTRNAEAPKLFSFRFIETIRGDAISTVKALKELGLEPYIASGDDSRKSVDWVATELGIPDRNVRANMKPQAKQEFLEHLSHDGKKVLFMGDGLNDILAMDYAHVSISIGEAKLKSKREIVFPVQDNMNILSRTLDVINVANRTWTIVKQNLFIACTSILLVAPAALGAAIPFWLVVLGHEGSTVVIVANSLRVLF